MLILYYGEDFESRNARKNKTLEILKTKRPDSVFSIVKEEDFSENFLNQNIESSGLFDSKSIFEINGSFAKKENEALFYEYSDKLEASDNAFIFSEDTVSVKTKNLLKKKDFKSYEFNRLVQQEEKKNIFILTDLFVSKDKKNIWLKYREFIDSGVSEEEIFGILFWAIKSLSIVSKSKSIDETNMKPFVYNKNKRFLGKWAEGEVDNKLFEMINIYHDSRRGVVDFKTELEKLILS